MACGCGGCQGCDGRLSGFGGFASFGDSLAPPSAVVNVLRDTYNDAVQWWTTTKPQLNGDTISAGLVGPLDYTQQQLDFNSGDLGAQMVSGSFAWQNYRDALDGFIKGIIDARHYSGFDTSIDVDPVASWYYYTATPRLAALTVTGVAGTAGQIATDTAGAALSAIPSWAWVVGGVALTAWLLSGIGGVGNLLPRRSTAGYGGLRRRLRRRRR